ncbi:hypothetical protein LTR97_000334 [Elasticomyces elasticus]|uniref:BTB domain-containing protein n=1 Tax=Elasticomyces elasticus TaxID=574655 RepID=A0AAN7WIS7_9PEZI|nr:hypothetical protein LTR97_000334 [Elasticomyces elasticus]
MDPTRVLKNGFRKLRDLEVFTDLTIICGRQSYKVHKALVCAQSGYFHKMCCNSPYQASHVTITLGRLDDQCSYLSDAAKGHDDEKAVEQMIDFFYGLSDPVPEDSENRLNAYAQLFAVAVKYHVPGLRKVAVEGFDQVCESLCSDGGDLNDFAKAIEFVYTTTRSNVRELRTIVERLLDAEPHLLEEESIKEAVDSVPGFAHALLQKAYGLRKPCGESDRPQVSGSRCAYGMECQLEECWQCGLKHRGCSGQCPQLSQEL